MLLALAFISLGLQLPIRYLLVAISLWGGAAHQKTSRYNKIGKLTLVFFVFFLVLLFFWGEHPLTPF